MAVKSTARQRFREILGRSGCTQAASIFDPLSARIASLQGWELCKLSGSVGKFSNLAVPDDIPMANMSDLVDLCWRINRVCDACLVVDADDGGGSALNVFRTVRELEAAGVAAIEIEDNTVPQRFGVAQRRHEMIVSQDEQVGKLCAAVEARQDCSTAIVARTSALNELPRDDAMRRISAYSATGVDAIMLPGMAHGRSDIEAAMQATDLPLLLLRIPEDVLGDTDFLERARVRVRYQESILYSIVVKAMDDCLRHLQNGGTAAELADRTAEARLLRSVDRTYDMQAWQDKYVRG